MKEPGEITCCVVDTSGLFVPLARKLGETYKRTLYTNPAWQKADPVINEAVIGDGFKELEWCWDAWLLKDDVDLWVFPDLQAMGMQKELRDQGRLVWGAGDSMLLETNRLKFLSTLRELGLDVPDYDKITGLAALADYLKDKEDVYIKMSKWRGSWETYHWANWRSDSHKLDFWAVKFAGVKEKLQFLCFPKIDTKLEIGADTYFIGGQWPKTMLHGIEKKDCAYLSTVTKTEEMPEELLHIMKAFSGVLVGSSQWSMEVRVTDTKCYFIDATIRGGQPSTGSQICNLKNLAQVVYLGAQGEMLEPEYEHQFTAECRVRMDGDPGSWETMTVGAELEPWLKLAECCEIDGQIWFPARDPKVEYIGWLVACADDPQKLIERMKQLANKLPPGVTVDVTALADILSEIEEEEKQGIEFANQEMPEPAEVIE